MQQQPCRYAVCRLLPLFKHQTEWPFCRNLHIDVCHSISFNLPRKNAPLELRRVCMGSFGRSVAKGPGPKSTNRLSLKDEGSYQHLLREYRSEKPQENHRKRVLLTSNAKERSRSWHHAELPLSSSTTNSIRMSSNFPKLENTSARSS